MTMRLSASSLAGTARTLVAVGTVSETFMFLTTAAAAPRSGDWGPLATGGAAVLAGGPAGLVSAGLVSAAFGSAGFFSAGGAAGFAAGACTCGAASRAGAAAGFAAGFWAAAALPVPFADGSLRSAAP